MGVEVHIGAVPHVESVDDPYDTMSPRHRWGPIKLSLKTAGRTVITLPEPRSSLYSMSCCVKLPPTSTL